MSETQTWDPSKWTCKQDVLIDNAGGTSDLTDYQLKLTLSSLVFDFAESADEAPTSGSPTATAPHCSTIGLRASANPSARASSG